MLNHKPIFYESTCVSQTKNGKCRYRSRSNYSGPTDAIIKVTSTAICGSDLHIYNGMIPQPKPMTLGHEFMGEVVEIGTGVTNLKKGDRVVVPFPIACGQCWFCTHQLHDHCENSNDNYGPEGGLVKEKGGALFGYTRFIWWL